MNRKICFTSTSLVILASLIGLTTCEIDHGLLPINSMIGGKLIITGEAPDGTDELRVGVIRTLPPASLTEILFSNQLPFDQDTVEYEVFVPPGAYDAVAVIWKEQGQSYNISNIVGVYNGGLGALFIPVPVTVPNENATLNTININVDLERVNRDAEITGTVHFQGEWPPSTGLIAVGAFKKIPEPGNFLDYYFESIYIDYDLTPFTDASDYRLRVTGDSTVPYIAALWIDDTYDLGSIRDIGFYADPQNPGQPKAVVAPKDGILENLDFTVDFSNF